MNRNSMVIGSEKICTRLSKFHTRYQKILFLPHRNNARGLEYLHEHITPPVIHRDFKASNILLDKNYNAKVSDFGLAKLGSEKLNGEISTRILGTTGYVAPE